MSVAVPVLQPLKTISLQRTGAVSGPPDATPPHPPPQYGCSLLRVTETFLMVDSLSPDGAADGTESS